MKQPTFPRVGVGNGGCWFDCAFEEFPESRWGGGGDVGGLAEAGAVVVYTRFVAW